VADEQTPTQLQVFSWMMRKIRADDVSGAVALHCVAFPDYFLTHMGQRFLERFYSEFIDGQGSYGFVALHDRKVVGCVLGARDYQEFFNRFYRRHFLSSALTLAGRILVDPYIRRNLGSRIAHARHAIHSLTNQSGPATPVKNQAALPPTADLMSIGIHPELWGSGLAGQLVDRLCEALWQDGLGLVQLWVRPDNQRAIAFYEKSGWRQVAATKTTIQFSRPTQPGSSLGVPEND
jgi:ribosomal protein S18 acetylase RimI-like enzyme